jgi:hypothetical protein
MFFGLIPFALGFGLGTLAAPRYVPYPPYPVCLPEMVLSTVSFN